LLPRSTRGAGLVDPAAATLFWVYLAFKSQFHLRVIDVHHKNGYLLFFAVNDMSANDPRNQAIAAAKIFTLRHEFRVGVKVSVRN